WQGPDGAIFSSVYSSRYLSWATAILGGILSIVGFYLVAGSIRRDRERGVGAILAATPLPGPAYLAGKFAAHLAYLATVSLLAVGAGVVAFVRWGTGTFQPVDFLVTWALFVIPAVALTAALAVFFDVTPGLGGRAGLVLWIFALPVIAIAFAPMGKEGRIERFPWVDPFGMATLHRLVAVSMPQATAISSGLIIHGRPVTRVDWPGLSLTPAVVRQRLLSFLVCLVPLAAATLFFDRFDPARARRFRRATRGRGAPPVAAFETLPDAPVFVPGRDATPAPSAARSVLAEARLTWHAASFLRWPLLAAALVPPFLPTAAFPFGAAALFLLLATTVAEVPAREELAGTRALVFSQPGVPLSPVLWKTGAVLAFVLAFGLPCAVRAAAGSATAGLAFFAGLLFTAGLAAGFGSLTAGGKLFLAVYTAVWYFAVNRLPFADFTGLLAEPSALRAAAFLLAGAAAVGAAFAAETRARA
ncbi:MAG TPA: hypothetical protein VF554_05325, partial [Thermoanaerobaculia bacterium]